MAVNQLVGLEVFQLNDTWVFYTRHFYVYMHVYSFLHHLSPLFVVPEGVLNSMLAIVHRCLTEWYRPRLKRVMFWGHKRALEDSIEFKPIRKIKRNELELWNSFYPVCPATKLYLVSYEFPVYWIYCP